MVYNFHGIQLRSRHMANGLVSLSQADCQNFQHISITPYSCYFKISRREIALEMFSLPFPVNVNFMLSSIVQT